MDVEHEEMVSLTTFFVKHGSRLFCQIREVDGVPQNGEVAARSPPLAAARTDARKPGEPTMNTWSKDERANQALVELLGWQGRPAKEGDASPDRARND
jgi:hypothetical protein